MEPTLLSPPCAHLASYPARCHLTPNLLPLEASESPFLAPCAGGGPRRRPAARRPRPRHLVCRRPCGAAGTWQGAVRQIQAGCVLCQEAQRRSPPVLGRRASQGRRSGDRACHPASVGGGVRRARHADACPCKFTLCLEPTATGLRFGAAFCVWTASLFPEFESAAAHVQARAESLHDYRPKRRIAPYLLQLHQTCCQQAGNKLAKAAGQVVDRMVGEGAAVGRCRPTCSAELLNRSANETAA